MKRPEKAQYPPERPLMIFDGDCDFCTRWIERWRYSTLDCVAYAKSQEVTENFPEIPAEVFDRTVVFIDTEGRVYEGAEAVSRATAYAPGRMSKAPLWAYQHVPGFAKASDAGYRIVARKRMFFSRFTKLALGKDLRPCSFDFATWLWGRLLGLVALIAFLSLWVQAEGLFGSNGILPFNGYLHNLSNYYGTDTLAAMDRFWMHPTVLWLSQSDVAMHAVFALGVAASVGLLLGVVPPLTALVCWGCYLSLAEVGQIFLAFQWDALLIECLFFSALLFPWRFFHSPRTPFLPPRIALWLVWFVLFRLMFESGVVKLQAWDDTDTNTWWQLTALNFHYWTQPLPHQGSWHANFLPDWIHRLSIILMLGVELVLPFFIFLSRSLRRLALCGFVLLQVLIIATGNYGFFNLLAMFLAIPLLDDQALPKRMRAAWEHKVWRWRIQQAKRREHCRAAGREGIAGRARLFAWRAFLYCRFAALVLAFATTVLVGNLQLINSIHLNRAVAAMPVTGDGVRIVHPVPPEGDVRHPSLVQSFLDDHDGINELYSRVSAFRTINTYGLFRMMTVRRPEIILEGSSDGENWKTYGFKYKPDVLDEAPRFAVPHMPRLDWQMWFAALRLENHAEQVPFLLDRYPNFWLSRLLLELGRQNPEVLALIEENPFLDESPKFLRVSLYHYRFADPGLREETGQWWVREPIRRGTF